MPIHVLLCFTPLVLEADDPQIADMETAFARIAECLGLDFIPYLQFVMPAVIARASVKPDPMAFSDEQAVLLLFWPFLTLLRRKVYTPHNLTISLALRTSF